jgi:hypothetical protein
MAVLFAGGEVILAGGADDGLGFAKCRNRYAS